MASVNSYYLLFACVSILFSSVLCSGSDAISAGRSLFPNQTIISKESKFELGFFVPGNSANYYIGMWYKNISVRTVVWVLNRDRPIPHSLYSYSQLELSNGTLLLRSGSDIFWAYNQTSKATEAVVLDSGDFVLRNASGIVWRSFEHPTDTWLPGAELGFTDDEQKLVSWTNRNDPASGSYSLTLRPDGRGELSIMTGGTETWNSGPWQGGQNVYVTYNVYNFTQILREGNVYVKYNVPSASVLSRIVMSYTGKMMHFRWSEERHDWALLMMQPYSCSAYASCGPNTICDINHLKSCSCLSKFEPKIQQEWDLSNFSDGCVRRRPLQCDEKVGFINVTAKQVRNYSEPVDLPNNACKLFCSNNCSCNAYAYDSGGRCLLFMADLLDIETATNDDPNGVNLYIKVNQKDAGKRKVLIVALIVPITAAVLVSCFGFLYLWPKLKNIKSREKHQNLLLLDLSTNEPAYKKGVGVDNNYGEERNNQHELPIFSFSSILVSTNNFSITNKLGEGGFGPVYRGELHNKQFVAVKRLSKRSGQGLEEFRNETELIAKLQHKNLVGILGCCIEKDEKILVYEYMPNKSLDYFIFEPARVAVLDWAKRVEIIEGIAQGLLYLHHYSRLRIVHRDLKASNILLDAAKSLILAWRESLEGTTHRQILKGLLERMVICRQNMPWKDFFLSSQMCLHLEC